MHNLSRQVDKRARRANQNAKSAKAVASAARIYRSLGEPLERRLLMTATISGHDIFYNNSSFDGNNAAINASDDGAIAPDKTALLPGGTATFANYTSYTKGINGIMVDIAHDPTSGSITAADFTFKVGNTNNTSTWANAPAPSAVVVRPGAGAGGSDRVEITWADGAIQKKWLQITLKADAVTQLSSPDVFYFGNAVGETGNDPTNAIVNLTDVGLTRTHQTGFTAAQINNVYDFNRDGHVNLTDVGLDRTNQSGFTPLMLITPTSGATTIGTNFTGNNLADAEALGTGAFGPPDTDGSVGVSDYVDFTNGQFTVYAKSTGSVIGSKITDSTFWLNAGIPSASVNVGISDPRIIYDPTSQRLVRF